ncbi:MAG: ABC transporter substrate-binding protein [Magnetococcales bacterium]|nr:ABC transporter substrate-binding protein [Magnetococcales bacterium]
MLQLRWDHQFQFAGYYAAQWQGYYAEEGLDVEIRSAIRPDGTILKASREVADGRAHFGIGSVDILVNRGKGMPLVLVATVFQKNPIGIFSFPTLHINSPFDLIGKKVKRIPGDIADVELQAMLRAEGIDPTSVKQHHSKGKAFDLLMKGEIDAYADYGIQAQWEAHILGKELSVLRPNSYGITFYGDSLFTSEEMASKHPDQVRSFRKASMKGWEYALEHSEEIADRISRELTRVRTIHNHAAFNRYMANEIKKLTLYPAIKIGHYNQYRWQQMHNALRQTGLVNGGFESQSFFFDNFNKSQKLLDEPVWKQNLPISTVVLFGFVLILAIFKVARNSMEDRKIIFVLVLIMTMACLIIGSVSIWVFYTTSLEQQRARLIDTVTSQARFMETVAKFDNKMSQELAKISSDIPLAILSIMKDHKSATFFQIEEAFKNHPGFGETGEFTLAKRVDDQIVFIWRHRQFNLNQPDPIPFYSQLAEPMRKALSGMSGTVIGVDYRNTTVVAAYEPVAELNLGVVAKIDLKEIRAPFIKAAVILFGLGILVVAIGSVLFYSISNPMIKRILENNRLLKQLGQRNESILNSAGEGIFGLDLDGNTIFINPSGAKMLGWSPKEIIGKNQHQLVHHSKVDGSLYESIKCPICSVLKGRKARMVENEVFWRKDRTSFPVQYVSTPIIEEEKIIGIVVTFNDITKRKQIENILHNSLKEKEVMLREIHHRVKNNMQVISGLLNLQVADLKKKNASKQIAIDALLESRNRIATMSKIHEKLYKSNNLNRINLQSYIKDLINDLFSSFGAREKGIKSSIDIGQVELTIEQAIPFGLILNELVTNSIKHAFPGGRNGKISVSVQLHPKQMVELVMKDDGVGVPNIAELHSGDTLGMHLIHSLTNQIDGKIEFKQHQGITTRLCFKNEKS